jgi:hypothetical protein
MVVFGDWLNYLSAKWLVGLNVRRGKIHWRQEEVKDAQYCVQVQKGLRVRAVKDVQCTIAQGDPMVKEELDLQQVILRTAWFARPDEFIKAKIEYSGTCKGGAPVLRTPFWLNLELSGINLDGPPIPSPHDPAGCLQKGVLSPDGIFRIKALAFEQAEDFRVTLPSRTS